MPYIAHANERIGTVGIVVGQADVENRNIELKIKENIYKKLGQPVEKLKKHLFLRSPFFHKNQLKKYFSNYEDLTLQRLQTKVDFTYYDGPLLSLRKMLHILDTLPIFGKLFGFIIENLVMLETKSSK